MLARQRPFAKIGNPINCQTYYQNYNALGREGGGDSVLPTRWSPTVPRRASLFCREIREQKPRRRRREIRERERESVSSLQLSSRWPRRSVPLFIFGSAQAASCAPDTPPAAHIGRAGALCPGWWHTQHTQAHIARALAFFAVSRAADVNVFSLPLPLCSCSAPAACLALLSCPVPVSCFAASATTILTCVSPFLP